MVHGTRREDEERKKDDEGEEEETTRGGEMGDIECCCCDVYVKMSALRIIQDKAERLSMSEASGGIFAAFPLPPLPRDI